MFCLEIICWYFFGCLRECYSPHFDVPFLRRKTAETTWIFPRLFSPGLKKYKLRSKCLKKCRNWERNSIYIPKWIFKIFFNVLWKVIHLTLTPYLFSQTAIAFLLDSSHHSRKITKSAQNVTKSPETGRKFILLSRNWPFIFFGNSSWTLFTSHWHPMLLLTDISSCVRPFFKKL